MKNHCDESEDSSSPASSTPLLNKDDMSEQALLYTNGMESPIQRKNKLGLHVDIEAATKRAETRFQNQNNRQVEPIGEVVEPEIKPVEAHLHCSYCSEMSLIVYFLVIVFGSGSWIAINGVWVELPLLVPRLPEGWDLPSYLSVTIQLANIGPLVFFIAYTLYPNKVKEKPVVYSIIIMGAASCFLLAFFWHHISYIGGVEHSTALLVLTFLLAFVDCTSSVVFLPFMALFPEEYMTAFYIGEGFSGLLPSLVSLGQGAGEYNCTNVSSIVNETVNGTVEPVTKWNIVASLQEPNFPVEDFYFFLFTMMVMCGIAFIMLNYLPHCKKVHIVDGGSRNNSPSLKQCKGKLHDAVSERTENSYLDKSISCEKKDKNEAKNDKEITDSRTKKYASRDGNIVSEEPVKTKLLTEGEQQTKPRKKHNSSPGDTSGLPDIPDGDDSVFGPDTATPGRRRHQSAFAMKRQVSVKPSRRRLSSFGPMDFSFSLPDLHTVHEVPKAEVEAEAGSVHSAEKVEGELKRMDYVFLLFLITIINALSNGVLPSTQTYSALPYGTLVYSLVVRLSNVMNPLACFLAFFLPTKRYSILALITAGGTLVAAYTLTLAGMSPHPPLYESTAGDVLTVIAWLTVTGLFSYGKVLIAMILRDDGRNGLIWCGALTQVGSTIGAIVTFLLVNVFHLFTSASYCSS